MFYDALMLSLNYHKVLPFLVSFLVLKYQKTLLCKDGIKQYQGNYQGITYSAIKTVKT